HIAYKVSDLDQAIKVKIILLKPYFPIEGFRVAIIEEHGVIIEFIETDLSDEEIWDKLNLKNSILSPS
ncbi:helicase, partial [Francisella tularensis subsp. holarctica]|nr:helicase [Francisella tularensis subsp. holarctica]